MSLPLDFEHLITFERIVREGSFSRAAWSLNLPQPTVSARIKALEQVMEGALFIRTGRRVALTDLGHTLLPYAQRAIAVMSEGMEVSRQARTGQRGRVTIGVLGSLAGAFLGPVLAAFHAAHPDVELLVRGTDHTALVDMLLDRVVELALITWPCTDSLNAEMTPLLHLHEPVILVAPPSHPLARQETVTQAEVLHHARPFIVLRWWQTMHPTIVRLASQAHSRLDLNMDSARHMVIGGTGIGFFTKMYISEALATGQVVEIKVTDLAPLYRDSAIVRLPRDLPLAMAGVEFIEAVKQRAAQVGILRGDAENR
ncbi:MAG: LysR family transcriptional regulator [Anaerolineae bacterium]|nr:LysR family transcriptional regulator [Anaerolineae bacterium]